MEDFLRSIKIFLGAFCLYLEGNDEDILSIIKDESNLPIINKVGIGVGVLKFEKTFSSDPSKKRYGIFIDIPNLGSIRGAIKHEEYQTNNGDVAAEDYEYTYVSKYPSESADYVRGILRIQRLDPRCSDNPLGIISSISATKRGKEIFSAYNSNFGDNLSIKRTSDGDSIKFYNSDNCFFEHENVNGDHLSIRGSNYLPNEIGNQEIGPHLNIDYTMPNDCAENLISFQNQLRIPTQEYSKVKAVVETAETIDNTHYDIINDIRRKLRFNEITLYDNILSYISCVGKLSEEEIELLLGFNPLKEKHTPIIDEGGNMVPSQDKKNAKVYKS